MKILNLLTFELFGNDIHQKNAFFMQNSVQKKKRMVCFQNSEKNHLFSISDQIQADFLFLIPNS